MTLVPVSAALLEKIKPGGSVEYYSCPMPEHADVRLAKPGKCPHCRMTLIPVMQEPEPVHPRSPDQVPEHTPSTPEAETSSLPPLYTCPMKSHAHIVSDQPGRCPDCEMKLVSVDTVDHGEQVRQAWRAGPPGAADATNRPEP
jgi:hypothetical protein